MPSSRLGAEVLRDSSSDAGRRDPVAAQPQSLPYPVDDIMAAAWVTMPSMPPLPSETEHQWRASEGYVSWHAEPNTTDYYPLTRVDSLPSTPSYPPPPPMPQGGADARPPLQRMYSTAGSSPTEQRFHPGHSRHPENKRDPPSSFDRKLDDLARAVKAKAPHCPGLYLDEGSDDWRTVRNIPTIHFCPDCIAPMRGTPFEQHLRRFQPPPRNMRIYCAFELPWMVRAWQYTLHDQRTDFSILRTVAEMDHCRSAVRGEPLRDAKGILHPDSDSVSNGGGSGTGSSNSSVNGSAVTFVSGFSLCDADYRKIKLLLPRAAALFVDKPSNSSSSSSDAPAHLCKIDTASAAFRAYWEALETINSRAKGGGRGGPDPTPLLEVIARKRRSRERNGRY